ncbi:MAG: hypothetical protein CVU87_10245 [Firmicutes bacterium HGW-Firmicutes-12]|nr:MAG: hypothetical protein CVU87_10245 [Firmicutes bacterium HGW-Firmicutes-12]
MKLVICIVSNKDVSALLEELVFKGYRATKLASTGGFLKEGNTTLLIGIDVEQVEEVFEIIENKCRSRKQLVTPISTGLAETFVPYPMEVTVGGATVFLIDVEKNIRV